MRKPSLNRITRKKPTNQSGIPQSWLDRGAADALSAQAMLAAHPPAPPPPAVAPAPAWIGYAAVRRHCAPVNGTPCEFIDVSTLAHDKVAAQQIADRADLNNRKRIARRESYAFLRIVRVRITEECA
jgi:hypothetical protein